MPFGFLCAADFHWPPLSVACAKKISNETAEAVAGGDVAAAAGPEAGVLALPSDPDLGLDELYSSVAAHLQAPTIQECRIGPLFNSQKQLTCQEQHQQRMLLRYLGNENVQSYEELVTRHSRAMRMTPLEVQFMHLCFYACLVEKQCKQYILRFLKNKYKPAQAVLLKRDNSPKEEEQNLEDELTGGEMSTSSQKQLQKMQKLCQEHSAQIESWTEKLLEDMMTEAEAEPLPRQLSSRQHSDIEESCNGKQLPSGCTGRQQPSRGNRRSGYSSGNQNCTKVGNGRRNNCNGDSNCYASKSYSRNGNHPIKSRNATDKRSSRDSNDYTLNSKRKDGSEKSGKTDSRKHSSDTSLRQLHRHNSSSEDAKRKRDETEEIVGKDPKAVAESEPVEGEAATVEAKISEAAEDNGNKEANGSSEAVEDSEAVKERKGNETADFGSKEVVELTNFIEKNPDHGVESGDNECSGDSEIFEDSKVQTAKELQKEKP